MTKEDAIKALQIAHDSICDYSENQSGMGYIEALEIAIKAIENIGHLKDRPCDACEFFGEHGCSKWTCVFCNGLFENVG